MPPPDVREPYIGKTDGFIEAHIPGLERLASFFDVGAAAASLLANKFDGKAWFDKLISLTSSEDESIRIKALKELRAAVRENLVLGGFIRSTSARLSGKDAHGNDVALACETQSLITSMKERPDVHYPNGAAPRVLNPDTLAPVSSSPPNPAGPPAAGDVPGPPLAP